MRLSPCGACFVQWLHNQPIAVTNRDEGGSPAWTCQAVNANSPPPPKQWPARDRVFDSTDPPDQHVLTNVMTKRRSSTLYYAGSGTPSGGGGPRSVAHPDTQTFAAAVARASTAWRSSGVPRGPRSKDQPARRVIVREQRPAHGGEGASTASVPASNCTRRSAVQNCTGFLSSSQSTG
jgi:hypothetical protein